MALGFFFALGLDFGTIGILGAFLVHCFGVPCLGSIFLGAMACDFCLSRTGIGTRGANVIRGRKCPNLLVTSFVAAMVTAKQFSWIQHSVPRARVYQVRRGGCNIDAKR